MQIVTVFAVIFFLSDMGIWFIENLKSVRLCQLYKLQYNIKKLIFAGFGV